LEKYNQGLIVSKLMEEKKEEDWISIVKAPEKNICCFKVMTLSKGLNNQRPV